MLVRHRRQQCSTSAALATFPVLGEASPGAEMQPRRLACDKSTRSVHAMNEHGRESYRMSGLAP